VLAASANLISNTASTSSSSADPDPGNNTDTVTIGVTDQASSPPVAPIDPGTGSGSSAPVPEPQLPRTGTNSMGPLGLASLLVGGGFLTLVIARRRRTA
jgi:LPXTG-motif cell wall-anchored protein